MQQSAKIIMSAFLVLLCVSCSRQEEPLATAPDEQVLNEQGVEVERAEKTETEGEENAGKAEQPATNIEPLVVYSARKEHLIRPLFLAYTEKTGVPIEYITDKAGSLLARLKSEGKSSPADILLTTDVGNLWYAKKENVLQPVDSETLLQRIPEHLRDSDKYWFGLTQRARTIVYNSKKINVSELSTYENLADEKWKDRLCLRTSRKVYNQSLVASLIAHLGKEQTKAVLEGWVSNLAVEPFSDDTAAMEAVMSGLCDVTLVNTYYFGRLEKAGKAGDLKIFWPNQQGEGVKGRGVHMNISGAGLTRFSNNSEQAIKLIEWLASEEAQAMLAGLNLEFPVHPGVAAVDQVKTWGDFKPDAISLDRVAENQLEAVKLIDAAGYR